MNNLEWAMTYHMAGWSIFPCKGKRPHFGSLASTGHRKDNGVGTWDELNNTQATEDAVMKWFTDDPTSQVALVCGKVSGVTVIDIDKYVQEEYFDEALQRTKTRKVLGKKTPDEIFDWMKSHIPITLASRTGSGGIHVFCKYFPVKNSQKKAHPQIDIKSDKGYVILPPSTHESGNTYAWLPGYEWGNKELPKFPEFLASRMMRKNRKNGEEKTEWKKVAEGAVMNSRHITLTKVCGFLLGFARKEPEFAYALLRAYNLTAFKTPKSEAEVLHIFEGILKADYQNNSEKYGE
jgi:hypothetical protein